MSMLKPIGVISLFIGGVMLFATINQKDVRHFALQIILGPALIYAGFKLLM